MHLVIQITLTTGTKIYISAPRSGGGLASASNWIQITPSQSDVGHTQGVCGTLNYDFNDDFTHRDGTISRLHRDFVDRFTDSWR